MITFYCNASNTVGKKHKSANNNYRLIYSNNRILLWIITSVIGNDSKMLIFNFIFFKKLTMITLLLIWLIIKKVAINCVTNARFFFSSFTAYSAKISHKCAKTQEVLPCLHDEAGSMRITASST